VAEWQTARRAARVLDEQGGEGQLNFRRGRPSSTAIIPAAACTCWAPGRCAGERGAIVDYLSNGDYFGEKSLLGPSCGNLIARSVSPVNASAFGRSELLDCVQQDRRFAARLLNNLARRLDRYEETIQDYAVERAERRLALLLWRFLPARIASGWVRLRFSPSNSELARMMGSTRWRIAHFMGRFQRLGWLERRPELWVLREGLQEFLRGTTKTGG
jgi:CRP-like cAMP-binding protein